MGIMCSKLFKHPEFEHKLFQCNNLIDVRKLNQENETANTAPCVYAFLSVTNPGSQQTG